MSGIRDLVASAGGRATTRPPSLLARLGIGPRGRSERGERVAALAAIPARIEAARALAADEAQLLAAAEALAARTPRSGYDVRRAERTTGTERVETTTTVATVEDVVTPATGAVKRSIVFDADDEVVADDGSEFRFAIRGTNVRVDVGAGGATLTELADLINTDSQNGGRLLATVVEDGGGYRMQVETTATGSSERLRLARDRAEAPSGGTPTSPPQFGRYTLFENGGPTTYGTDESITQVESTEDVAVFEDRLVTETIETRLIVEDAEYGGAAQGFVDALNALWNRPTARALPNATAGAAAFASVRDPDDPLASALSTVVQRFAAGETESGLGLASIGLSAGADGTLRLDAEAFRTALADDPAGAASLLSSGADSLAGEVARLLREGFAARAGVVAEDPGGGLATDASAEDGARGRIGLVERLLGR